MEFGHIPHPELPGVASFRQTNAGAFDILLKNNHPLKRSLVAYLPMKVFSPLLSMLSNSEFLSLQNSFAPANCFGGFLRNL
jgi:hypothetical protein